MIELFDKHDRPAPQATGFVLRDYQAEDAQAVYDHWEAGELKVLCVHATGLGKSVLAAELVRRRPVGTRAIVVVDSTDLAMDLFRTIKKHTQEQPGILCGEFKETLDAGILVCTKQCLCALDKFREMDWSEVSTLVIDECESSLANEYVTLVQHFIDVVPGLRICGMTATPLPANDRAIADLFPHAADSPGPLYRDLQWSYLNGWLVKPKQGVLRCSMDFSTLKLRKNEAGERDFSDKDIARLMLEQDERQWLELAGGIYQISKGYTTIVVCPNSTQVADKLAGYIEGHAREDGADNIAFAIHRKLGKRRSWDLMRRFKRGEFPIAVSVRMFEKGFDYDKVNMVVMCRRTKSLRLYTQVAGRATRPLKGIRQSLLDELDAVKRKEIIAGSEKPSCTIVDCVGLNDQAKNLIGVIDILGRGVREDIKERVRRMMLDKARLQEDGQPRPDEAEDPGMDVGDQAREAIGEERREREEREREKRAAVSAKVDYRFELDNPAHRRLRPGQVAAVRRGDSSPAQVRLLLALGVSSRLALSAGKRQAGAMIHKLKKNNTAFDWRKVQSYEAEWGRIT